jgi:hypothetical protein
MNEVVGGVLTDGLVAIIVQVQGLVRPDISQSAEYEPANPFVAKFQRFDVLEMHSIFLGVVDARDKDGYVRESSRCDV